MIRFCTHRLLAVIPILFGVSVVGFLLMKLVPGDPTFFLLGPYASQTEREVLRESLGLNSPLPVQYVKWLGGYVHGDFGQSVTYNVPVAQILGERVVNSLILTAVAFTIAALLGFLGGVLAAIRPYSLGDRLGTIVTLVLASSPPYWLGLVLVYLLALRTRVFPVSGMYSAQHPGGLLDLAWHVALPAFTAGLIPMAVIFRLTRSGMMDQLAQQHIQAARARGLPERAVVLRHALRHLIAPLVNISGLQIGVIFGTALFSEVVFGWPGVGLLIFSAIGARDLAVIQAVVLFTGLLFVTINLVADTTQAVLDPRIR
jgi:peptide/nickel transport system permease protein